MAAVGEISSGFSATTITLAAPGQGRRWYLLNLSAKSSAANTLTVISGGKTVLQHTLRASEGYTNQWKDAGNPGLENTTMVINMTAGTLEMNYRAVVR